MNSQFYNTSLHSPLEGCGEKHECLYGALSVIIVISVTNHVSDTEQFV